MAGTIDRIATATKNFISAEGRAERQQKSGAQDIKEAFATIGSASVLEGIPTSRRTAMVLQPKDAKSAPAGCLDTDVSVQTSARFDYKVSNGEKRPHLQFEYTCRTPDAFRYTTAIQYTEKQTLDLLTRAPEVEEVVAKALDAATADLAAYGKKND